jgi:hypothetical protein
MVRLKPKMEMAPSNKIQNHRFRSLSDINEDSKHILENTNYYAVRLDNNSALLTSLGLGSLEVATFDWVIGKDKTKFLEGLRVAHLAITSHWAGMNQEGPHSVQLPNRNPLQCADIAPNSDITLGSWLNGIYLAMVFRDIGALKVYAEVDREWLTTLDGKPDPWVVPYIDFLSGIWEFDPDLLANLHKALLGTDPSLYAAPRADYLLNIISPQMELWAKVFSRDYAVANQGLYEQQKIRHDWHEALGDDTYNSIMEYIDLAGLAAACYLHDLGMQIEVKSDYLPEFLINGDFPKLEWPDPEWKEWPKA